MLHSIPDSAGSNMALVAARDKAAPPVDFVYVSLNRPAI